MQSYDVLMIVVLLGATAFGAWKGMAWQIASIASLVVSYFASLTFSPRLAPFISDDAPWNRFIAMLVIYLLTSMIIWMIFRAVSRAIERVQLKEFDRQIGALFGLAKGILLCVAITMFAVTLLPGEQKEKILGSKSGFYIAKLLNEADQVMPEEMHEVLHPYIHKAQETLDPNYVPHGNTRETPRTAEREGETFSNHRAIVPETETVHLTAPASVDAAEQRQWAIEGEIRRFIEAYPDAGPQGFLIEWERIFFLYYPEHSRPLKTQGGII